MPAKDKLSIKNLQQAYFSECSENICFTKVAWRNKCFPEVDQFPCKNTNKKLQEDVNSLPR